MNDGSSHALGLLVEPADVPPGGAERARSAGTRRNRRRRASVAAGVAALAVLVVALLLPGRDVAEQVTTDPATAPPGPVVGAPLLDLPQAALDAQPVIPDGWKPVDYGLARVWVPKEWKVIDRDEWLASCPDHGDPVVVLGQMLDGCTSSAPHLVLSPIKPCECGWPTQEVNGLVIERPGPPQWTAAAVQLLTGLSGEVPGVEQIVLTIEPSPVARVLAAGPTVRTEGWQPITVPEVPNTTGTTVPGPTGIERLWVPGSWQVRHVTATDQNPVDCGTPLFGTTPTVWIGKVAPLVCTFDEAHPHGIADGARLPDANDGHQFAGLVLASELTYQVGSDDDVVDLDIATSTGWRRVIVGIGPDPAVARTILRTLSFG